MNTSATWLSATERRSLMRPSPPQNGVAKESLIPAEMTTNIDDLSGGTLKSVPSIGNASLRIGFVHHEDSSPSTTPVVVCSGSTSSSTTVQLPQNSQNGIVYRNMEQRHVKPIEWRIHLAGVKVC